MFNDTKQAILFKQTPPLNVLTTRFIIGLGKKRVGAIKHQNNNN